MSENTPEPQDDLRASVAAELGLPASLGSRLVGSTREELLADAEDLLDYAKPANAIRTPNEPTGGVDPYDTGSDVGWSDREANEYAQYIRNARLSF